MPSSQYTIILSRLSCNVLSDYSIHSWLHTCSTCSISVAKNALYMLPTLPQEILDEADRVLTMGTSQLLSYDTTFQLGDFYVSPLIFRHTIFEEKPCIPAMFLVHERKFADTHHEMFKECVKHIPALKKAKCPLVTDKEQSIVNAAQRELQNIALVHCWNHLFRDIRQWLHRQGAPAHDITVYSDDVSRLFHSTSEEEYLRNLKQVRPMWDPAFEQYYMKQIHPDVTTSIGRWVLEKLHIYNPYSGVTNNQSESLNRVIKDLQGWKEAPIDCVLLAIYQLQAFYMNEIRRGFAGIGEYHLTKQYTGIQLSHTFVEYIPTSTPEDIVAKIKNSECKTTQNPLDAKVKEEPPENSECNEPNSKRQSMHARAKLLVESNNISFDPKLHVFNVKGSLGVDCFPTREL